MKAINRRNFLSLAAKTAGGATALSLIPPSIMKALAIPANSQTGTINDVEHVVILMQENRSFDHYFGTLHGVRGFGDKLPIPLPSGKSVWHQKDGTGKEMPPYHMDTRLTSAQRVPGTPHLMPDAQSAWAGGRMDEWPKFKTQYSMGYYRQEDMPFQFALANAFTICDSYHCSFHGGTNPNRLHLWTGMVDPTGKNGGPVINNDGESKTSPAEYSWTTYPERLEEAGVSWRIYQDANDNFGDNSLEGFANFRRAKPDSSLWRNGMSTWTMAQFATHAAGGTLPQVSWLVAPAKYSEHPGPSSPIQGAEYTQQVLNALTANPDTWSKTVLLVMFDENDGFFDHVPPPATPAKNADGSFAGKSTVDTQLDYHTNGQIYGLGPRVPMYVISPWSKGGWVNSEVFDHTSVIKFLENRFGVFEPNISPWRRAVCGDLMSAFNFAAPNDTTVPPMPSTSQADTIVLNQSKLPKPTAPLIPTLPRQNQGTRPSRALPYELHTSGRSEAANGKMWLIFSNTGKATGVFHVYDQRHLDRGPRRYTVEPGKLLSDDWNTTGDQGLYDLWVLGPNGFHRHFKGNTNSQESNPEIRVCYDYVNGDVYLQLQNTGSKDAALTITANDYRTDGPWPVTIAPSANAEHSWPLYESGHWYDFSVTGSNGFVRRFAGRVETGRHSISDPTNAGTMMRYRKRAS
ncbi:phosphocholine-specific phospholipase C [Janthinobacterium sp. B9-8]|uniref:phosphocholine-specific phospholipase C n=1 Tax=Janthinobacterium sp. B9-8 TaxID=1236179 RepID=UPI00061D1934|nr:phospholipase C, phosphocholine-specific [Janthinobacterium sp. B9-8]AMC33313.1 phospholipase C, phosphocholine-specific [Janthinobacterium sp. B9-8]